MPEEKKGQESKKIRRTKGLGDEMSQEGNWVRRAMENKEDWDIIHILH